MDVDIVSWLNLAFRWLHLVTGIAWIGSSFYFIWLDNSLAKPADGKPGVSGELWAVHGGGFYHKQKYMVAPEELPADLHWFKWEAYFTWISGFLLLSVMYYYGAELYLIDSAKLDINRLQAIGLGLASLVGGWLVYDWLCKSPIGQKTSTFALLWFLTLVAAAYGLTNIFSDRGAFIHVGAIIGTVMAANVFMIIIPNQRKVVAAMTAGETPDPALGKQAKQRSLHNNYMTLPVLLIMISNHYPMVFGHHLNWLLLAGLGIVGWMFRHFFNLKHVGKLRYELAGGAVAGFLAIMFVAAIDRPAPDAPLTADAEDAAAFSPAFVEARAVIDAHCVSCHSAAPTHELFTAAPGGVMLNRPDQIQRYAAQIYQQAVASDIMPLGNETGMTEAERALLGAWIDDGASLTVAQSQ
ncbi:MAG: urate hydroxylase PuuD [Pseudomonadota bacterium]